MTEIRRVAIVVPARDEQTLLPGCLEALGVAVQNSPVPTQTIVVLDSCADGSADVCRELRVETIEVEFANVGRARHAGVISAIQSAVSASSLWIANTDADSRVAPDWVAEQVRLAGQGADAVLGVTDVTSELQPSLLRAHQAAYIRRIGPNGSHSHVHGANLGIRASTYVDAGGFPPLTDHEDQQLVLRVRAMRSPVIVTTTSLCVKTSGRTMGRCSNGFARSIANLTADAAMTSAG
jgi:glycosyltransferase involved in cell wall biosynthesis